MKWIWEHKDWPNFKFDAEKYKNLEIEFQKNIGILIGTIQHIESNNLDFLKITILSQETVATSNIEGEVLERESVQSSIKKHLGLKTDNVRIPPNVNAVSELMVDVYQNYSEELNHTLLFKWHKMLMINRKDIETIGNYRSHIEPMQIVSSNYSIPKLFFEAPASNNVKIEMDKFFNWYNEFIKVDNTSSLLILAGISHLWFEIIHPFEDGNGRIGRALVEKIFSQNLKRPTLNSLAKIIEINKKQYYESLQSCNHDLNIDKWLSFFL